MKLIGRNPARIIPFVSHFVASYPGRRIAYVGEPAWPGRSEAELTESAKHEALINQAFTGTGISILCPYHTAQLPPAAPAAAAQTHPHLSHGDQPAAGPAYLGPTAMPASCLDPLPAPPPGTTVLHYDTDLEVVRELTERRAAEAGRPDDRATDLVLAVGELMANTLLHTRSEGTFQIWQTPAALVCQVHDSGWITDTLAGRRHYPSDHVGGHGLWLVNHVCDLVQTRTSHHGGTTTRIHMSLPWSGQTDKLPCAVSRA